LLGVTAEALCERTSIENRRFSKKQVHFGPNIQKGSPPSYCLLVPAFYFWP